MGEVQNRSKPDDALDDVTADVVAAAAMRGVGEGVPPSVHLSERRRG
jgi:hypothetical protein